MRDWLVIYAITGLLMIPGTLFMPTIVPTAVASLLNWLREYEFLVTSVIAIVTTIIACIGLWAVRESLKTDGHRFKHLSTEAKDFLKALNESGWRGDVYVDYAEIASYMALDVGYRNLRPYPSGFHVSRHFHLALRELVYLGMMEQHENNFSPTYRGYMFLNKFGEHLKERTYQGETAFEDLYLMARELRRHPNETRGTIQNAIGSEPLAPRLHTILLEYSPEYRTNGIAVTALLTGIGLNVSEGSLVWVQFDSLATILTYNPSKSPV